MESDTQSTRPKWKTLLRQNSEKIGTFAEAAVLPKNQRSHRTTIESYDVTAKDVEAENTSIPALTVNTTRRRQKKYFPIFIIGISLIEILLTYCVDLNYLIMTLGYDPNRRHEIWRFITMMLTHTGFSHLWYNVILQFILGVLLEIVHGWKRISVIYLSSVVGGALFVSVLTPQMYIVGASGAVFGLLFAHLSTIIINWNEMDRKVCRLFWLLAYISFEVGYSLYNELILKANTNTSHAAHLGGAITGFCVAILVLKNFEKHPWEKKMQKICIGILTALGTIILLINLAAWGLYLKPEWNFDYERTYTNYICKTILLSPEDSEVRKSSEIVLECKQLLEQFNGTINST